ncbi:MAG TPA: hypothetical protein VNV17_02330 [Solirubrobacteraceae bacterium]|jgi:hypothetical protein|nr:hypothetical protein [Solirubrobacteraceae bacterium]
MTITLDYSDLHFEEDRDVLVADEYAFQYDLLYARITFRVDAADFTIKDEYTPLLDVSAGLRRVVDLLSDGEAKTYDSPVSQAKITFTRSGDQVAISANYTGATANVAFTELRDTVKRFHERVTRDVLERYPGLGENPGAQEFLAPDPARGA